MRAQRIKILGKQGKSFATFSTSLPDFPIVPLHVKVPLGEHLEPLVLPPEHRFRRKSLLVLRAVLTSAQEPMAIGNGGNDAPVDQGARFRTNRIRVGRG